MASLPVESRFARHRRTAKAKATRKKYRDRPDVDAKECAYGRARSARIASLGLEPAAEKRCTRCGLTKPGGDFPRQPSDLSGLASHCRACGAERAKARREADPGWQARRAEHDRKKTLNVAVCRYCKSEMLRTADFFVARQGRVQTYCLACNRQRLAEYKALLPPEELRRRRKASYERNRHTMLANKRKYAARPEVQARVRERARLWRATTGQRPEVKERYRVYHANRRALEFGLGPGVPPGAVLAKLAAQGGLCFYCGVELGERYDADHFYPLKPRTGYAPGLNDASNIVIACVPCNRRKNNRQPFEWFAELARRQ